MGQNSLKFIFFIGILSIIISCNEEKNKSNTLFNTKTTLNERDAISGWYNFPLELKIDSVNSICIDTNLLKGYLLSTDSQLLTSDLLNFGNIRKWSKPKTKEIKTGVPLFINDSTIQNLNPKIYFDRAKKLNDQAMVLSLLIEPNDLFNYNSGIYIQGVHKNINEPKKGNYSQRGKKWHRRAYAHLFNNEGDLLLESDLGVKIHGNLSRAQPQKSFSLIFNSRFNSKIIKLNLFGEQKRFHRMILRTPFTSSMQGQSLLMDSFIGNMARKMNLDAMGSTPCNLYINGEYWGLYHLREKIDQHYLADKFMISKKSISIVEFDKQSEGYYKACYGEKYEFDSLINFLNTYDISKITNYQSISKKVDINNLIDYLIVSTFFANKDWPGNNFKFWKSTELDNKWRFIIHDMDACFRNDNMFEYLLAENKKSGNNIFSSTLLFRKLFKNKLFLSKYTARYKELKETILDPSFLKNELNLMASKLEPSIEYQVERWHMPDSKELWMNKIEEMSLYIENRHETYTKHLKEIL